jgi:hypothetical protein
MISGDNSLDAAVTALKKILAAADQTHSEKQD